MLPFFPIAGMIRAAPGCRFDRASSAWGLLYDSFQLLRAIMNASLQP